MNPSSQPGSAAVRKIAVEVYARMQERPSRTFDQAAGDLGVGAEERAAVLEHLRQLGLVMPRTLLPAVTDTTLEHIAVQPQLAFLNAVRTGRERLRAHRDYVVDLHRSLDEIADDYLPLGFGGNAALEFVMITDRDQVSIYLDRYAEGTNLELLSMQPRPMLPDEFEPDSVRRAHDLTARGLRPRTLYSYAMTKPARGVEYLRRLSAIGYDVRVAETVPAQMIVFDRRRALILLDPRDLVAGAVAIEGDAVVPTLADLFEFCWQHSSELVAVPAAGGGGPTVPDRAILRLLADGATDRNIARALGISERSVSRQVGEISRRLGAKSRFQMGVRAVAAGLID
jgi:DNA-binding CsgD family transcriptional regulator